MRRIDRRGFLGASAAAGSAGWLSPQVRAQTVPQAAPPEVTRILARYIVGGKLADIPEPVRKEAARTLLNWTGCALGGSRNEAVGIAISALSPLFGPRDATLLRFIRRITTVAGTSRERPAFSARRRQWASC